MPPAASYRGRLYVVGGYGADRRPLRAAFVFDGRSWRRLPDPPEARAAAAAAVTAAGKLYVVGGRIGDRARRHDPCPRPSDAALVATGRHDATRASCGGRTRRTASTRSRGGGPGSTRTSAPSRCSTRAPGAGAKLPSVPDLSRRHRSGCDRGPDRLGRRRGARAARSPTCGRTTSAPGAGRACPTCPRRGTASASSPSAAGSGRSRAALAPA